MHASSANRLQDPDLTPGSENSPAASEQWLLWQLADSAFPTGGFAHSGGLEALWQHRVLSGGEDLKQFVESALRQLGHASLPFAMAAFRGEVEDFHRIDALCDAFTSNHVANRASRLQGQAFLATAERSFGHQRFAKLRQAIGSSNSPTHFAPVFGAIGSVLGIAGLELARLFIFVHLRGWISSAVRLGVVGPMEGQQIQFQLAGFAEGVVDECIQLPLASVAQTNPFADLLQGTQDRLYSRLFQS